MQWVEVELKSTASQQKFDRLQMIDATKITINEKPDQADLLQEPDTRRDLQVFGFKHTSCKVQIDHGWMLATAFPTATENYLSNPGVAVGNSSVRSRLDRSCKNSLWIQMELEQHSFRENVVTGVGRVFQSMSSFWLSWWVFSCWYSRWWVNFFAL